MAPPTQCPHAGTEANRLVTVGQRRYWLCYRCTARAMQHVSGINPLALEAAFWEPWERRDS